jgi:hypothetical protein
MLRTSVPRPLAQFAADTAVVASHRPPADDYQDLALPRLPNTLPLDPPPPSARPGSVKGTALLILSFAGAATAAAVAAVSGAAWPVTLGLAGVATSIIASRFVARAPYVPRASQVVPGLDPAQSGGPIPESYNPWGARANVTMFALLSLTTAGIGTGLFLGFAPLGGLGLLVGGSFYFSATTITGAVGLASAALGMLLNREGAGLTAEQSSRWKATVTHL